MRPVIAFLITVFLFAGVYVYTEFARSVRKPPIDFSAKLSSKDFSVEITRTFDCIGDPDWEEVKSLVVKFRGEVIISETANVPASRRIFIEKLEGVLQRGNNLYVFANVKNDPGFGDRGDDDWNDTGESGEAGDAGGEWSEDGTGQNYEPPTGAMRILVKRDETVIADQTFWLEAGATSIEESLNFEAPVEDGDKHDP